MDEASSYDEYGYLRDDLLGKVCPGVGVGVFILGDGRWPELGDEPDGEPRVLMGLRGAQRTESHPGGVRNEPHRWDIPGGGVEMGEALWMVAAREVTEETGVIVDAVEHLFHIEHFPDNQHWISHTHVVTLTADSPAPSIPDDERDKCVKLRYFTFEQIEALGRDHLTTSMLLNLERIADGAALPGIRRLEARH